MNAILKSLWLSPHRRQLLMCASILFGSTLLATAGVFWAHDSRSAGLVDRDAEQAAWSLNSAAAADLQEVASALPQHESSAVRLLQDGFGAAADRVGWTESVVAALNALHPVSYVVEVGTAQQLPLPDDMLQSHAERGLQPPTFEVNDLSLKVQGLTEDELVRLLNTVVVRGGGIVRMERCRLERRADALGLDAECSLRRYSIRTLAEPAS
jgi:hypothetical protein